MPGSAPLRFSADAEGRAAPPHLPGPERERWGRKGSHALQTLIAQEAISRTGMGLKDAACRITFDS